jgi:hypothetical protein
MHVPGGFAISAIPETIRLVRRTQIKNVCVHSYLMSLQKEPKLRELRNHGIRPSLGPPNFGFLSGTTVQHVGGTPLGQQKIVGKNGIGAETKKSANCVPWAND